MNTPDDCPSRRDDDTIARWVAGTLEPDDTVTFEAHLLTCTACQEAVREAATIRAARPDEVAVGRSGRHLWWMAPVGLAAAVGLFLLLPRIDPIERLGGLGPPPPFEGVAVRANVAEGSAEQAMRAYQAGDYRTAARLFQIGLAEAPSTAVRFFLAASMLWSGRTAEAIPVLTEVVADSLSPYAPEAGFYLAKAHLRRGDADSALAVLQSVHGKGPVPVAAHARALADSIRQARVP